MKYLSVCSGIEAASVAWEPLGWEPVAFSEIEAFPSAVLAHHFPHVPNLGDMTKHETWNIKPGSIDLLVGGTPCQSFSVAGLRKGLHDPRGGLMLCFVEIAQRLRPRWVVWENVPGVLSSNGGRDFGALLGSLADLGYGWAYRVLDAQYVRTHRHPRAVPQRRRRVFVVGCAGDWRRAAEVLFEEQRLRGPAGEVGTEGHGASCTTTSRTDERDHDGIRFAVSAYSVYPCSGQGADLKAIEVDVASGISSGTLADITDRGIRVVLSPVHDESCAMDEDCLCDAGDVPSTVRRLTVREVERLQAFPDDWTRIPWRGRPASDCPDGPRYRALGNSMAVNCMEWIGQRIADVEARR